MTEREIEEKWEKKKKNKVKKRKVCSEEEGRGKEQRRNARDGEGDIGKAGKKIKGVKKR